MNDRLKKALFPAVRFVARVGILPWKWLLRHKLAQALKDAEDASRAEDRPSMMASEDPFVRVVKEPSPSQLADFARWRSPSYVAPMTDGVADAFAMMVLGLDRPEPLSLDAFRSISLHTPSAYLAEGQGDWWDFDFSRTRLYTTRKMTIRGYRFSSRRDEMEVIDAWGRSHRRGNDGFDTAFLHAICWWSHMVHSGLHNWVHFHFPDCVVEAHTALSNPRSVLARVLAPHVRFTARINMAGLWTNQASDNGPGRLKRLKPWGAGQTAAVTFRRGIFDNTSRAYADLQSHFSRPDRFDRSIPYLAYIQAYFAPIERFVAAIEPSIEDEDWAEFLSALKQGLPDIESIPRVRCLAIFIWQVGIVHAADHLSFVRQARRHIFHRVPETLDRPFRLKDVGRYDRFKTRNFLNVFVDYNPNPDLKHSMIDIENYEFVEPELREAAERFRQDLSRVEKELRSKGLDIVPLKDLLQSVCF